MAQVTLNIGDRTHTLACHEGEQAHFERLAAKLDSHWATAARASGGMSGERTMLFVALILADQLDEAERRPSADADAALLTRIAERLESVAAALEDDGRSA